MPNRHLDHKCLAGFCACSYILVIYIIDDDDDEFSFVFVAEYDRICSDPISSCFMYLLFPPRNKFSAMIDEIGLQQPAWKELTTTESAVGFASMGEICLLPAKWCTI